MSEEIECPICRDSMEPNDDGHLECVDCGHIVELDGSDVSVFDNADPEY